MSDTQDESPSLDDANKDTGETSVASASTGTSGNQTRFSFYNADDFVPKEEEEEEEEHKSPSGNSSSHSRRSRNQDTPANGSNTNGTRNKGSSAAEEEDNMDAVQILRSLQEHEQQREEILGGPSSTSRGSGDGDLHVTTASTTSSGDGSNPYEDAIKEALDLLRKHRISPSNASANSPPSASLVGNDDTGQQLPSDSAEEDTDHSAATDNLGEAYQVEIEARRRQRQERMARYATRLAELKQDTTTETPASATSNAAAASNPWATTPGSADASYLPEETAQSLSQTSDENRRAAKGSQDINSNNTNEEVVQRGVERVLLAILERANTSSRERQVQQQLLGGEEEKKASPSSLTEHKRSHDASSADTTTPIDANELVLAMSDLLGTSTTSPAPPESAPSGLVNEQRIQASAVEEKEKSPEQIPAHDKYEQANEAYSSDEEAVQKTCQSASRALEADALVASDPDVDNRREQKIGELLQASSAIKVESSADPGETSDDELDRIIQSASSSDPARNDTFDEIVRQVLDNGDNPPSSDTKQPSRDVDQPEQHTEDDSFDRRARTPRDGSSNEESIEESHLENSRSSERSEDDDDDGEENSWDESQSEDEDFTRGSDEDEDSYDDSKSDDESSYDDEDGDSDESEMDGVLGPLSKKAGGTTGVVLEADSPLRDSNNVASPILDSLAAAVSMVTSAVSYEEKLSGKDKYSTDYDDEDTDDDEEEDSDTVMLMKTLCAHLLPAEVDKSAELLEAIPEWDESNPDEMGYRIIRLTKSQLRQIEEAFDKMNDNLKQRKSDDSAGIDETDETFERDLQVAEELLDREEKKLLAAEKAVSSAEMVNQGAKTDVEEPDESSQVSLEHFPGVKQIGRGEMGDLEYFHLPVVFKSHVTGFEPTKDLSLEPGNIVAGQYLVEGELGSAAFSTAYRCTDLSSDGDNNGHEEVCLKVIKNTKDFFDQSLDEIKILELLRQTGKCHENFIIEMKTFFYHREHLVIVTELLRQNLFEFGKFIIDNDEEPYFTLTRLSYISRQCLISLNFVHKLGLVHSDVKPENILLASYSRAKVKLIDFGSSCYLTDRQSSYIQSRSYRAPEVVLGLPYDGRIDIWSIGCVVAEMFTGEVTFQNDSIVSMLSRIESICGAFPRSMVTLGRQSSHFFSRCGLLYEKVSREGSDKDSERSDDDDDDDDKYYDIFQPKATSLAARLGFDSDLMDRYNSGKTLSKEVNRQAMFADFVRNLLIIDPEKRPTASQALEHPLMKYAATLTEEDIKYPSS